MTVSDYEYKEVCLKLQRAEKRINELESFRRIYDRLSSEWRAALIDEEAKRVAERMNREAAGLPCCDYIEHGIHEFDCYKRASSGESDAR